jgi:hypothetical protein
MATKTAKFRKLALRPGEYAVVNPETGERVQVSLSEDRLKKAVKNTNQMLKDGYRIPVPFAHADEKGRVPGPVLFTNKGAAIDPQTMQPIGWRADLNAGYVDSISYGEYKGESGVVVDFNAVGDVGDHNTPAGKIGTTVRETSLVIQPDYTGGNGKSYGEVIYQVAAVTNPVETGQQNFALAMSDNRLMMATPFAAKPKPTAKPAAKPFPPAADPVEGSDAADATAAADDPAAEGDDQGAAGDAPIQITDNDNAQVQEQPIDDLIRVLNEFGLSVPDDTTPANLVDRLRLCLRQKLADQGANNQDGPSAQGSPQPPQGAGVPGSPIAMSTNVTAAPASNPAVAIMLSQLVVSQRDLLKARANKLIATGRVTKEWVEKNLFPRINAIQMNETSLTPEVLDYYGKHGVFPPSEVEHVISGLESVAGPDLTVRMSDNTTMPQGEIPGRPEGDISATPSAWVNGVVGPQDNDNGYKIDEADLFELAAG